MRNPIIFLLSILFTGIGCSCQPDEKTDMQNEPSYPQIKFKGASLVSPSGEVSGSLFEPIAAVNANWTAIIPFGFIAPSEATVQYNLPWQWWGERDEGVAKLTKFAHDRDIEVMLKPQVWLRDGAYTGDYEPSSETGWKELENSYQNFILHFAKLADSLDCGAFCIGTEWKKFHQKRPSFWSNLIDSVRAHFSGIITYASNWDSYQTFAHWEKLDFIGIDAYFPLSEAKTPTVAQCKAGWQPILETIEAHQKSVGKPVIFTEFGYRSADYCAKRPWEEKPQDVVNMQSQTNAYQALYEVFWEKPWFSGGFFWKWFPEHAAAGGTNHERFTPQNKPAEDVIREWYEK